jgi:streptogramin lyase
MKTLLYWMLSAVLMLTANQALAAACGPVYGADGIAVDASGNVWTTHYEDIRLGKLDTKNGRFEEYLPSNTAANPLVLTRDTWSKEQGFDYGYDFGFYGIALDDRRELVWFIRFNTDKLIRFSRKDRRFSEIALPGRLSGRFDLPIDKDGNIWLLAGDQGGDIQLMQITPDGSQKGYPLPMKQAGNLSVAFGKEGAGWLALTPNGEKQAALYRFVEGRFERVALPSEIGLYLTRLHVDAQGDLWLAEGDAIWRLHDKEFKRYTIPTPGAHPSVLASDGLGNLWFTEWHGNKIGRIAANGEVSEFPIPPEEESPLALTVAADGKVWFSVMFNYDLFRLDPANGNIQSFPLPVPGNWSKNAAEGLSACVIKAKDAMTKDAERKTVALQSSATEQMVHSEAIRHPLGYPDDQGAVAFERNCHTACHTWYRMDKAASRRTDWGPTVDRMIDFNKAVIDQPNRDLIVRYLNRHYTMKK